MDSKAGIPGSEAEAALCRAGTDLAAQGQTLEALRTFLVGAQNFPDQTAFVRNAGTLLVQLGRMQEAIVLVGKAIEKAPHEPALYTLLATWLTDIGQPDTAARLLQQAAKLEPDEATHHLNLGSTYLRLQDAQAAEEALERALGLDPDCVDAYVMLGILRSAQGRTEESRSLLRRAIDLRPTCGTAYYNLARSQATLEPQRIEDVMATTSVEPDDRARMHFALGLLYDAAHDHDRAFAHCAAANELIDHGYDPLRHRTVVREIAATYTRDFLATGDDLTTAAAAPVFIVGLPRTGSTLVEQILRGHPHTHGIGEHALGIPRLAKRMPACTGGKFPAGALQLTPEDRAQLAQDYFASLVAPPAPGQVIVDKMLDNYLHLGLIEQIFPQARILHCRRHPIDTAWSAFRICFARNDIPWSYDLEHLAQRHEDYAFLMEHWSRVSGLPRLDVAYEDLVADPESWTQRILEFCGLDPAVELTRSTEVTRPVFTSSANQVRTAIHTKARGRWKAYERHLGPLLRLA